ncbi:MAG: hypothetical protein ACFE8E_10720 [Candidatus Hodarchaeota archaeon]
MEIHYGKMILYGILSAIFYLAIPLAFIYGLEYFNIMTFSETFKITVIIFGVVGVVFSMLNHAFPKDTSANRLVKFGSAIYSGIFLFYIFGGFDPGRTLGSYFINYSIPNLFLIQALLGLQIIAWLFLGSTIIRALQYLIEAIELRKKREFHVTVKKKFKLSRVFKGLGIVASLIILGYFGSIIFSGMNLRFNLVNIDFNRDPGINPDPDISDDSLNITFTFNIRNMGLYAINDVSLDAELRTLTTANNSVLPFHTKIGGLAAPYQNTFHSFSETLNENITISINNAFVVPLLTTNATLSFSFSFSTVYAWIFIGLNFTLGPQSWVAPFP